MAQPKISDAAAWHVVLVAIEHYPKVKGADLKAPVTECLDLLEWLREVGVPARQIHLHISALPGQEARVAKVKADMQQEHNTWTPLPGSKSEIFSTFLNLKDGSKPGQKLLVVMSGHGKFLVDGGRVLLTADYDDRMLANISLNLILKLFQSSHFDAQYYFFNACSTQAYEEHLAPNMVAGWFDGPYPSDVGEPPPYFAFFAAAEGKYARESAVGHSFFLRPLVDSLRLDSTMEQLHDFDCQVGEMGLNLEALVKHVQMKVGSSFLPVPEWGRGRMRLNHLCHWLVPRVQLMFKLEPPEVEPLVDYVRLKQMHPKSREWKLQTELTALTAFMPESATFYVMGELKYDAEDWVNLPVARQKALRDDIVPVKFSRISGPDGIYRVQYMRNNDPDFSKVVQNFNSRINELGIVFTFRSDQVIVFRANDFAREKVQDELEKFDKLHGISFLFEELPEYNPGFLKIDVSHLENEIYEEIDDFWFMKKHKNGATWYRPYISSEAKWPLGFDPGIYKISTSPLGKSIDQEFVIESGQTTQLKLEVKEHSPFLNVLAEDIYYIGRLNDTGHSLGQINTLAGRWFFPESNVARVIILINKETGRIRIAPFLSAYSRFFDFLSNLDVFNSLDFTSLYNTEYPFRDRVLNEIADDGTGSLILGYSLILGREGTERERLEFTRTLLLQFPGLDAELLYAVARLQTSELQSNRPYLYRDGRGDEPIDKSWNRIEALKERMQERPVPLIRWGAKLAVFVLSHRRMNDEWSHDKEQLRNLLDFYIILDAAIETDSVYTLIHNTNELTRSPIWREQQIWEFIDRDEGLI